jgi:hypothetical protein
VKSIARVSRVEFTRLVLTALGTASTGRGHGACSRKPRGVSGRQRGSAPMKSAVRTLFAVVVGMALAFALVVAVEVFGAIVHPIPADFTGTMGEHVRRYPHWVLGVAALAWAATATAATWVASRLGTRLAGTVVALLLAWALVFNLTMLPYTLWFKVVMFSVFPIASILGIQYGMRRST